MEGRVEGGGKECEKMNHAPTFFSLTKRPLDSLDSFESESSGSAFMGELLRDESDVVSFGSGGGAEEGGGGDEGFRGAILGFLAAGGGLGDCLAGGEETRKSEKNISLAGGRRRTARGHWDRALEHLVKMQNEFLHYLIGLLNVCDLGVRGSSRGKESHHRERIRILCIQH